MLQATVQVTIPDFEIKDRYHPFDSYLEWHRLKVLREPTDFNRYCYAKALFYDMQTKRARYYLEQCSKREIVTHFLRSYPYLLEGDYRNGLPLREYRLQAARYPLHSVAPQWDGKPTDRRLIIWQEGGFGDVIQYARYLPKVLARCPNASAVIDKALYPLIALNFDKSLSAFDPSRFDLQCSFMSLPHLLEEYDPDGRPYLNVPLSIIDKWRAYRGKVGFISKGNPQHSSDPLRSLTPEETTRLIADKDWVSIDPTLTGAKDWLDTAGIIMNLERLVTVDTAVAHLAGALGKSVYTLINKHHDWRYSRSWYNTMRVFRCTEHSNWEPVFQAIESALHPLPVEALNVAAINPNVLSA